MATASARSSFGHGLPARSAIGQLVQRGDHRLCDRSRHRKVAVEDGAGRSDDLDIDTAAQRLDTDRVGERLVANTTQRSASEALEVTVVERCGVSRVDAELDRGRIVASATVQSVTPASGVPPESRVTVTVLPNAALAAADVRSVHLAPLPLDEPPEAGVEPLPEVPDAGCEPLPDVPDASCELPPLVAGVPPPDEPHAASRAAAHTTGTRAAIGNGVRVFTRVLRVGSASPSTHS